MEVSWCMMYIYVDFSSIIYVMYYLIVHLSNVVYCVHHNSLLFLVDYKGKDFTQVRVYIMYMTFTTNYVLPQNISNLLLTYHFLHHQTAAKFADFSKSNLQGCRFFGSVLVSEQKKSTIHYIFCYTLSLTHTLDCSHSTVYTYVLHGDESY